MELHNRNQSEQLPYEKLALLGIDREKADNLPQEVKERLVSGEVTPLMQVSISARNGDVITLPLKLQMTADKDGNPAVEVNGEKTQQYLQLDPETKSVIHRRVTDIEMERKLKDMEKVNDIELGTQQKQQVRDGKPVELNVGGEKVSVGIDLKEPQGFKLIKGDMKEWERQQKLRYDDLHPEYLGLVMTDKNRWEYQQVVDAQSKERALTLKPLREENIGNGLKR